MFDFKKIILIVSMILCGLSGIASLFIGITLFAVSVGGLYITIGAILILFGLIFIYYTTSMFVKIKAWW